MHQANQLVQSAGDLAAQAAKASSDLDRLNDGAHDVASGAKTLDRGLATAETGARTLDAGIGTAATGADQLSGGSATLASGLHDLADGADDLHTGLGTLDSGSKTLATQLQKGTDRIPALTADEQDRAVQVLSSPGRRLDDRRQPGHLLRPRARAAVLLDRPVGVRHLGVPGGPARLGPGAGRSGERRTPRARRLGAGRGRSRSRPAG